MEQQQHRENEAIRRALGWCDVNTSFVPAPVGTPETWSALTRQYHILTGVVASIDAAALEQGLSAQLTLLDATDERKLRENLRAELRTVTQVAYRLRKRVPGIGLLTMPSTKRPTGKLLEECNALIGRARVYSTVLIEHGLDADFIQQLEAATAALKASFDGRGLARARQINATKHLVEALQLGHETLGIMDAALTKALRTDGPRLAEWRNAKRVLNKPVMPKGTRTPTLVVESQQDTRAA